MLLLEPLRVLELPSVLDRAGAAGGWIFCDLLAELQSAALYGLGKKADDEED